MASQSGYLASEAQEKVAPPSTARSTPGPTDLIIDIRYPSLTGPVKAPVSMDLHGLTSGAPKINSESLRILSESFKLDVAEREVRFTLD